MGSFPETYNDPLFFGVGTFLLLFNLFYCVILVIALVPNSRPSVRHRVIAEISVVLQSI